VLDFAKLELGFFVVNTVDNETTLVVIQHAEVLASFFDSEDVLESNRILVITADFSVDLDQPLLDDLLALHVSKSILEAIAKKDHQWHAFTEFVRTSAGARGKNAG